MVVSVHYPYLYPFSVVIATVWMPIIIIFGIPDNENGAGNK
jgi:hypothetical protein